MSAARGVDYTRVPNQDEVIEMKAGHEQRLPSDAAVPQKEEVPPSQLKVIGVVVFYLVAALVMIMVNKWVLNAVQIPLFFLFCQLLIAVLLLHLCALFGAMKLPRMESHVCKGLVPLIACNVLGLAFNTYCLQFVDASFYQIARGLILPFTVFFSWWLLGTKSSFPTLAAVALVCFGFMAGVSAENIHTSLIGITLGVLSSVTTSVHAIVVKRSLAIVSDTLDLAYYSNLLSALVILPFVLVSGEIWVVLDMASGQSEALGTFITGAAVTGLFGFLICIAGFLSIKVTSPISHMVSAAVRGVLQTFLGIWLFNDVVGTGRATGIIFILTGSTYYVYTKAQENAAPRAPPAESAPRVTTRAASSTPSFAANVEVEKR
ncbi:BQ2448_2177 [Microbotryum intermedium]|uniref:BQ2448_2177 protein n=1 Tax=Microbotryum intermedium TaxID=269621 RepID=A0A238F7N1_9BASI|nr:BQ2448_2177 [Microbotryum intermedium]